jgi:pyrroloquinoline quinone (PQQ) biosynthesis protein C
MPMSGDEFVERLDRELEPLRREASTSIYFDSWCSGKLSIEQVFELMKQRYAYLREIPHILAAWIQNCPYVDVQQKYIAYLHEEAGHPEYLVAFAKELGRDPEEMRQAVLIPEFTTPYFYYWLSRGHIVEVAAANNFGNERTNTRKGHVMHEATVKYYPYPSLIKFFQDHAEEEGDHANLGVYVLKKYATTDELQDKATAAAKKSLQLKILGQNALCRRFVTDWPSPSPLPEGEGKTQR